MSAQPHCVVERLDHIGIASADNAAAMVAFAEHFGFPVESTQTDTEVQIAVESFTFEADVAQPADVGGLIAKVVATYGRLDCAHNNAGIEGQGAFTADYDIDAWNRVLTINLTGVWLCMKYEIPQMLKQGGGAIVNTSSDAGLLGFKGGAAYVASKHGVVGLTKTAALEYAKAGIRINAVCPGAIDTPMMSRITGDESRYIERMVASEPAGRMGHPREVAAAVVWLCSEAASFVTGHAMVVDGGLVAQ